MTTARVRVPGTTSNLGAGFDCVGAAVDRWLEASVRAADDSSGDSSGGSSGAPAVTIERAGTLAGLETEPADDLLYQGFAALCAAAGRAVPGRLAFAATSEIPVARGLGSSSAALVAGARLANEALALGRTREQVAALCAGIEGHPDNAAPAVFGGAVLGVPTARGGYAFAPLTVHPAIAMAFAVPDFPISTSAARAILPAQLPHRAAVAAAAKSAALVRGLASGDAALLAHALDDVLHVPFRRSLIPGYDAVVRAAVGAGAFGATLSGSGSTMVAVAPAARARGVAEAMEAEWAALGVRAPAFVQERPAEV